MIREGEMAPEFELESDRGDTVRLTDLRGKRVVLYFYPRDDTSGCTKQACSDNLPEFEATETVVLGVSPDDVSSHRKFRDKYKLNFPLLADPEHQVAAAYGAWGKKRMYGREYEGILRTTFVIDRDGRVERVYEKVKPADHAEALLSDLAEREA
jgi:peroxiredoxin Q/BCP